MRDEKLINAFQKEKPHLVYLEKLIKKLKYGRLTVVMRLHNGEVTDLTTLSAKRLRFDKKDGSIKSEEKVSTMEAEKEIVSEISA